MQCTFYLVRAGELGGECYFMPTMSKRGEAQIRRLAEMIRDEVGDNGTIRVYCGEQTVARQVASAEILAEALSGGKIEDRFRSVDLIYPLSQANKDGRIRHWLFEQIRAEGLAAAVIQAPEPTISQILPIDVGEAVALRLLVFPWGARLLSEPEVISSGI